MKPERVFVGLGSNLGDPQEQLAQALRSMEQLPQTRLLACSALYRSAPLQANGPDFLNAVAELSTEFEPLPLLAALQAIEAAQGRQRSTLNAPRTLDLDLLLYGQRQMDTPVLILPHPRLYERAFVLRPLLELAPNLVHPMRGPLQALLASTLDQRLERLQPKT